jgi:hypothetical protein
MDRSQIEIAGRISPYEFNRYALANGLKTFNLPPQSLCALIVQAPEYSNFRELIADLHQDFQAIQNIFAHGNGKFSRFRQELSKAKNASRKGETIDDYLVWLGACSDNSGGLGIQYRGQSGITGDELYFKREDGGRIYLARLFFVMGQNLWNYSVSSNTEFDFWLAEKKVYAVANADISKVTSSSILPSLH